MTENNSQGVEKTLDYLLKRKSIADDSKDEAGKFSYGEAVRELQLGNPDPAARLLHKDRVENRTVKRFVIIINGLLDELAVEYSGSRIWGSLWPDRQEEIATGRPPAISSTTH